MRKGSAKFTVSQLIKFGVAIAFAAILLFATDRVIEEIYQQSLSSALE